MRLENLTGIIKEKVIKALKSNKNTTVYYNHEDGYYVTSEAITKEQGRKEGHQVALVVWDTDLDGLVAK